MKRYLDRPLSDRIRSSIQSDYVEVDRSLFEQAPSFLMLLDYIGEIYSNDEKILTLIDKGILSLGSYKSLIKVYPKDVKGSIAAEIFTAAACATDIGCTVNVVIAIVNNRVVKCAVIGKPFTCLGNDKEFLNVINTDGADISEFSRPGDLISIPNIVGSNRLTLFDIDASETSLRNLTKTWRIIRTNTGTDWCITPTGHIFEVLVRINNKISNVSIVGASDRNKFIAAFSGKDLSDNLAEAEEIKRKYSDYVVSVIEHDIEYIPIAKRAEKSEKKYIKYMDLLREVGHELSEQWFNKMKIKALNIVQELVLEDGYALYQYKSNQIVSHNSKDLTDGGKDVYVYRMVKNNRDIGYWSLPKSIGLGDYGSDYKLVDKGTFDVFEEYLGYNNGGRFDENTVIIAEGNVGVVGGVELLDTDETVVLRKYYKDALERTVINLATDYIEFDVTKYKTVVKKALSGNGIKIPDTVVNQLKSAGVKCGDNVRAKITCNEANKYENMMQVFFGTEKVPATGFKTDITYRDKSEQEEKVRLKAEQTNVIFLLPVKFEGAYITDSDGNKEDYYAIIYIEMTVKGDIDASIDLRGEPYSNGDRHNTYNNRVRYNIEAKINAEVSIDKIKVIHDINRLVTSLRLTKNIINSLVKALYPSANTNDFGSYEYLATESYLVRMYTGSYEAVEPKYGSLVLSSVKGHSIAYCNGSLLYVFPRTQRSKLTATSFILKDRTPAVRAMQLMKNIAAENVGLNGRVTAAGECDLDVMCALVRLTSMGEQRKSVYRAMVDGKFGIMASRAEILALIDCIAIDRRSIKGNAIEVNIDSSWIDALKDIGSDDLEDMLDEDYDDDFVEEGDLSEEADYSEEAEEEYSDESDFDDLDIELDLEEEKQGLTEAQLKNNSLGSFIDSNGKTITWVRVMHQLCLKDPNMRAQADNMDMLQLMWMNYYNTAKAKGEVAITLEKLWKVANS